MPVEMVAVVNTLTGRVLGERPAGWLDTFPHLTRVSDLDQAKAELKQLTVPQLRELADELGLDLTGLTRKADILSAVQQHRTAAAGAADDEKEND